MKTQPVRQYDAPHQFEPLLPEERALPALLEQASDLTRAATAFVAAARAASDLRTLLRAMNSFYTNKLEGEHTRPAQIEQALQADFSRNAEVARRQRIAIAHMAAEERCENEIDEAIAQGMHSLQGLYTPDRLAGLHRQLFDGLGEEDLRLPDGSLLVPGVLRTRQVAVGIHEPPVAAALPRFLARWSEVYGSTRRGELSVVAAAAAHHRLAWVHPFPDGNGRVARLQTHLVLHAMGLTKGLWSPLRAFARTEGRYKAMLRAADEHRRGDLDGRGNLTQQGLVEWIGYALECWTDQVQFMAAQLDLQGMQERMHAALAFDAHTLKSGVRVEALRPLHYLFVTQGELSRAEFKAMTGLGERNATELVSSLLKTGYLQTDSAYGRLRFAVPRHALRFYFPNLWPEAEQDREMQEPRAVYRVRAAGG